LQEKPAGAITPHGCFYDLQIAVVAVSIHRSAKGAAQFLNDLA